MRTRFRALSSARPHKVFLKQEARKMKLNAITLSLLLLSTHAHAQTRRAPAKGESRGPVVSAALSNPRPEAVPSPSGR